ncbi:MAG: hypothetical protein HKP61_07360 [Dactylosporangium sp.]|nr:hypothetical protein [Dactylosporangium sp.]NNJ60758.1 hypothetical protein [Dactylosporangium sp.]
MVTLEMYPAMPLFASAIPPRIFPRWTNRATLFARKVSSSLSSWLSRVSDTTPVIPATNATANRTIMIFTLTGRLLNQPLPVFLVADAFTGD